MKKLNITKKQYQESSYFTNKYGRLEYVSESGRIFKTSKGNLVRLAGECRESTGRAADAIFESSSIPLDLRQAALKAQRLLKDKAILGDRELEEFANRARRLHREELASAAEDILAYREAAKGLTGDRDNGSFVGEPDEYE